MKNSKLQFVDPFLQELHFVENPNFDPSKEEIQMKNEFTVQIGKHPTEKKAYVALILESNMHDKSAPFELRIKMASDFTWEDMDENKVDEFLKVNAPALLIGYIRPIVASITNSSKFPAFNLPMIDFTR